MYSPVPAVGTGPATTTLFFSLPFGIDAAIIILAARRHTLAWIVPLFATGSSLAGAALTFWMGVKIGEKGLDRYASPRRLKKIRHRTQTSGAVVLAAFDLIPPPFPFTLVVLAAGALEVKASTFFITLGGCRLVRFGSEALLAVIYGQQLLGWFDSDIFHDIVAASILLAVALTVLSMLRFVRATARRTGVAPLPETNYRRGNRRNMATVGFLCDLSQRGTPLPHCWEHTVGSCHAPLALRADWQAQLRQCHEALGFRYVRFHGLLSDDVGTLVRTRRGLLDSFLNADRIVDFLLSIGMKPFVELSFMPEALASGPTTVFKYRGNVTPPCHYRQWAAFIKRLVAHWVARYGIREVADWFFEVWNEPNLEVFWTGSRKDYFQLYRTAVGAIKEVDAALRVGGPATARDGWIDEFIHFCETADVAVDFVSTHHYPTDASYPADPPGSLSGLSSEAADTETQLARSRRGILRQWAQDTRRRARGRPLYYTEWNTSSNPRDPLHDEPYAAAFVAKTLLEVSGLVEGYSFWTFSDIFEENYFPSVPFHGGFGLMTLHGIPKPTYRAFELVHRLGHERLLVDGLHHTVDGWVVRDDLAGREVTILLTNHALPRHAIDTERVRVALVGATQPRQAFVERIDWDHANPKREWCAIGSPEFLDAAQVEHLHTASRLARESIGCEYEDGTVRFEVTLPPHAVAAVTLGF